jgi:hypothetical protein
MEIGTEQTPLPVFDQPELKFYRIMMVRIRIGQ